VGERDNLAVVRALYEDFASGEHRAAFASYHPDVDWDVRGLGDGRQYRGHAGVREFWRAWLESFDDYAVEVENLTAEEDQVLAEVVVTATGHDSGVPVEFRHCQLWTLDAAGLVTRVRFFESRAAAEAELSG
jgi:ketosteroid isomerase-like protein